MFIKLCARVPRITLVVFLFELVAGTCIGEEYRNAEGHFRFQAPPNWVRFQPAKLADTKRNARNPDGMIHEGFEPAGLMPAFDGFALPYLVVIEVRKPLGFFVTYDRIEHELNTKIREEFQRGAGGNGNLGPITLDRGKNRFWAEFTRPEPNGLLVRGKVFGFFGKENFVMLVCSSREREFAANQASFDGAADSFRFDEGYEFKPFGGERIAYIVGFGCAGCCCVLSIGIGVGALIYFLAKR